MKPKHLKYGACQVDRNCQQIYQETPKNKGRNREEKDVEISDRERDRDAYLAWSDL